MRKRTFQLVEFRGDYWYPIVFGIWREMHRIRWCISLLTSIRFGLCIDSNGVRTIGLVETIILKCMLLLVKRILQKVIASYGYQLKRLSRRGQGYVVKLISINDVWNDFRLFKLSRTSNLQIQEEFFTPRDYQKPQLDFTDILATMHARIKIRIHKSVMDRVLDYCTQKDKLLFVWVVWIF